MFGVTADLKKMNNLPNSLIRPEIKNVYGPACKATKDQEKVEMARVLTVPMVIGPEQLTQFETVLYEEDAFPCDVSAQIYVQHFQAQEPPKSIPNAVPNTVISAVPIAVPSAVPKAAPKPLPKLSPKPVPKVKKTKEPSPEWLQSASAPVLRIKCEGKHAELYKEKFYCGSRGKCIKYRQEWYTPTEFEVLCSKDHEYAPSKWRKAIEFNGLRFQCLIDSGMLRPYVQSGSVAESKDNKTATPEEPQNKPEVSKKATKRKEDTDKRSTSETSSERKKSRPSSPKSMKTERKKDQAKDKDKSTKKKSKDDTQVCDMDGLLKHLNGMGKSVNSLYAMIKQCTRDVKSMKMAQKKTLEQLVTTVMDQLPQADSVADLNCFNCARPAYADCSMCRRVSYCSTFCQEKDWVTHQHSCAPPDATADLKTVSQQDKAPAATREESVDICTTITTTTGNVA